MNNSKGVYLIRCKVNQKIYTGSTGKSFKKRWAMHRSALSRGEHCNQPLQHAWNKYGKNNFVFLVLENMPMSTTNEILEAEQWFLDNTKTHTHNNGGYNIAICAIASMSGLKFSKEHRRKMSEAQKRHGITQEHRAVLSKAVPKGEAHSNSKLTEEQVLWARYFHKTCNVPYKKIGEYFSINRRTIYDAITKRSWKSVEGNKPMETYPIHDVNTYETWEHWPLTCIHCGSEEVIKSDHENNYLCCDCGRWQLEEEE